MAGEWKSAVPFFPGMWRDDKTGIQLIGSTCESCGEVYFPKKEIAVCSHCQSENISETVLSRTGHIVSHTMVYQSPAGGFYKGPVPFIYVIVELPEGVHVPGHLIGCEYDKVEIGLPVQVVLDLLYEEDGVQFVTFKFAPKKDGE